MSNDAVKQYLRQALGTEGAPSAKSYDVGAVDSVDATLAAFSVALDKVFFKTPEPAEVSALVARIREVWVEPETLEPVLAENIILAIYGKGTLIDDIVTASLTTTENLITYGILHESGVSGDAFEYFLDEVVDLMNEPVDG